MSRASILVVWGLTSSCLLVDALQQPHDGCLATLDEVLNELPGKAVLKAFTIRHTCSQQKFVDVCVHRSYGLNLRTTT